SSPQVHLAEDYHLIQALAAQCADQTFSTAILPRRPRSDRSIADTHRADPRREVVSVGIVVVAHQVGWRRGAGKCLGDLPSQPLGCRMPRHLEPQQLSPATTQNQECKQEIKGQRRHNAHIDGGNRLSVILQKSLPGLRRWLRRSRHIFRDRDLNRSATNILSACRIANIALNDAMILPYGANLGRMEFSERTLLAFAK